MKSSILILLCVVLLFVVKVNFFSSAPQQQVKPTPQKAVATETVVDKYSDGLQYVEIRDKETGEKEGVFRMPLGKKYRTRNVKFSKDKINSPNFKGMDEYDKYADRLKKK